LTAAISANEWKRLGLGRLRVWFPLLGPALGPTNFGAALKDLGKKEE